MVLLPDMEVYRISKKEHSNLEGHGGLYYPGRWHEVGYKVIYTAQHRSLAALEYLVHLSNASLLQSDFVISTIYLPDKVPHEIISNEMLSENWTNIQRVTITRKMGTNFLKSNTNLYLQVPSAIIHGEYNFIINPNNPLVNYCKILNENNFRFDGRLMKKISN
jgi:RES domain-containing protein